MKLIRLENGAVLDIDEVLVIGRKNLNEYQVVLRNCPIAVDANLNDLDFIGTMTQIYSAPKAEITSKLEVVDD